MQEVEKGKKGKYLWSAICLDIFPSFVSNFSSVLLLATEGRETESLEQWISNLSVCQNHLEDGWVCWAHPQRFSFGWSGMRPQDMHSCKFPGDADAPGPGPTL